jgi:hypothetical protein
MSVQLSAADIIAALHSNHYTIEERVAFVRALRDSTPGLVVIDPREEGRVRAARGVKLESIDTTINALENSEIWQQTCAVSPKEIRAYRQFPDEHRSLAEELRAYLKVVIDSIRYNHFLAIEKARAVFKAGQGISGEAALTVKPHLDLIAETRPQRRRRKAETPVASKQ